MLSMQVPPPDLESSSHGYLSHQHPDRRPPQAEPLSLADFSMDDSLSHRASVTTSDSSNESPESWDDGPSDTSPPGDGSTGVKFPRCPPNMTGPSAVLEFNVLASPEESDAVPKVEELDDNDELGSGLQGVKPVPGPLGVENATLPSTAAPANVPRKRGRPRKHPLPVPGGQLKITKGRSKTGCVTCRRRKKKCDETKPA